MPHIEIANDLPGISGLFVQRPDTAGVLSQLADTLLREGESPLSRGERELIATYVSGLATALPADPSFYKAAADVIVVRGYSGAR